MSSDSTDRSFWTAGDTRCLASSAGFSETSSHAAPLNSAFITLSSVIDALTKTSYTTRAEIGIVPSATVGRETIGLPKEQKIYYRFHTAMLCLRCPARSLGWRCRTNAFCMASCFAHPAKRYQNWRPIPKGSEPGSGSSPCCTPGRNAWSITHTSIALFLRVA